MKHAMRVSVLMAIVSTAWAGDIDVDGADGACVYAPQGDPYSVVYCTIQDAIGDAAPGDTIHVAPGTYNEAVTVDKDNITLLGSGSLQTAITGGIKLETDLAGLTFESFSVSGNAVPGKNSIVRMYGSIRDIVVDDCIFDGENVSGRHGFTGGQLVGNVTVTSSEFKNILGWAVLDSKSGSSGDGSAMDTVTFANNYIHNCNGSVVFRGLSADRTDAVILYSNTWSAIGGNNAEQGQHWAALEINRTVVAIVYGNTVDGVSEGQWGEGQALQFWDIDTFAVRNNVLVNNFQGIWIYGGGSFAVPGGLVSNNNISGNSEYGISVDPTCAGGPLNAENNWWGDADGPEDTTGITEVDVATCGSVAVSDMLNADPVGSLGDAVSENVDYCLWLEVSPTINVLKLDVQGDPAYLQPGTTVVIDMDALNLAQHVTGCQAMLNFSSTYFLAGVGEVSVAPGGGIWDLLIWNQWTTSGDLDVALGVDLNSAIGTQAYGTVAIITLTADPIAPDGTTQMVFRADHPTDDTQQTFFSDLNSEPVWPTKINSQTIVIDGSAPSISTDSTTQSSVELLIENGSATSAVAGTVNVTVTASDPLAGLDGVPAVTVTPNGGSAEAATFVNESPIGTFNYTWTVQPTTPNGQATIDATVSDKSGNPSSATAKHFNINKEQVTAEGPVSFSINGSVDPNYDGLDVPGSPLLSPPWAPPPTPVGAGPYPPIRFPAVPQAEGIATARPGDVNDYLASAVSSEAEVFQSEPDHKPAGPPAGTNNQILQATAMGLGSGYANVNALTFGEDFFPGDENPQGNVLITDTPWQDRNQVQGFIEPALAGGNLPITFTFSVDPWAIGSGGTAVRSEATLGGALTLPAGPLGSADVYALGGPPYGVGPWTSDGEASGDVFDADPITWPAINNLGHDDASMALLAPRNLTDMEDDLDALENVGANTLWGGPQSGPGNTHDRVAPTSGINGGVHPPDLGNPFNPNHDPNNTNPIIFSVDRGTYGSPGSAVAAQVSSAVEGASGDLFIAVTIQRHAPAGPWVTTNMLLVDEGQLGLMPHDDVDAVIMRLLIPADVLANRIEQASANYDDVDGSEGQGWTFPLLIAGEAVIGFSVDTASIGLFQSAVDFECRVDGAALPIPFGGTGSGIMEQSGDIFYSGLRPPPGPVIADLGTGLPYCQNYLWFEESAIGLDPGAWSLASPGPIPPSDLGDLPDELNALDSKDSRLPCNPDLDGDSDVDVNDFLTFSNCFNGALYPPTAICANLDADLDQDGDVDVNDFLTFSNCHNGALRPPRPWPNCLCFGSEP